MSNPANPDKYPQRVNIPKPTPPTKSDQVRAIVELTLSVMQKRLHKNGNVYLVDTETREVFFIDEETIFNKITDVAFSSYDIVISNSAIETAKRILKAETKAIPSKISIRVGIGQHSYFLDLADGTNFIRYSSDGAEQFLLDPQSKHLIDVDFLRPPNLSSIDARIRHDSGVPGALLSNPDEKEFPYLLSKKSPHLTYILGLTNIPETYYSTVITWMVCTLFPERDQTILEITGAEDSGKSTAAWIIKSLIDPTDKKLNEAPNSLKELLSLAQNNYIIAIDNADDISDPLQKHIYELLNNGINNQINHGNSGHKWTINLRNPVIAASTSSILSNPLLIKKGISLDLPTLDEKTLNENLNQLFQETRYQALLELVNIAAGTLNKPRSPSLTINDEIYFDNLALTGVMVCKYFNANISSFAETLSELRSETNENIIDESVVARSLLLWAAENPKYKENKPLSDWQKDLFKNLPEEDRNDWPKSTRKFGAELKKVAPRLKKKGVSCKSLGKQGSNVVWEIRVTETTQLSDDIDDV
ncbi:MAG: ATP-binding protein [Marinobacter sp.]|nr:ATP-binding protein [Marinobacter sp.]|tara:strand:+ start:859 stop:2454 length:1596 start_codon:yes stop_codon:yes gene_type:complete